MGCGQSTNADLKKLSSPVPNDVNNSPRGDPATEASSESTLQPSEQVPLNVENGVQDHAEHEQPDSRHSVTTTREGASLKAQPQLPEGRTVDVTKDTRALPEHLFLVFQKWPVLRPGLPEFLWMLLKQRGDGRIKKIYIYTANTSLDWVKFLMLCITQYYGLPNDTFAGIKHAPGGQKIVPDDSVLYDDHPENVQGNCVPVDPYTNEIPWDILEPLVRMLPDDGKGGLDAYIAKDRAYADVPHEPESEGTLLELCEDFEAHDNVLLDLDETLISGARASAYYFAINHFLQFKNGDDVQSP